MKKSALLNSQLSEVIARSGHTDRLVVGDAGLPIPPGVERIDLALTGGIPTFIDTLRVILGELQVESIILAEETARINPAVFQALQSLLPDVPIQWVSHTEFKAQTAQARAAVRTGEFSPYANVILVAGVVF